MNCAFLSSAVSGSCSCRNSSKAVRARVSARLWSSTTALICSNSARTDPTAAVAAQSCSSLVRASLRNLRFDEVSSSCDRSSVLAASAATAASSLDKSAREKSSCNLPWRFFSCISNAAMDLRVSAILTSRSLFVSAAWVREGPPPPPPPPQHEAGRAGDLESPLHSLSVSAS